MILKSRLLFMLLWGSSIFGMPGYLLLAEIDECERGLTTAVCVEQGPAIDGNMTDPLWQKGSVLHLGSCTSKTFLKYGCEAHLLFDQKNVYIGVRCYEPDTASIKAKASVHDGAVWDDDSVEIFLHADQREDYFQFAVNPSGVVYDGREKEGSWNSTARAAGSIQEGVSWTVTVCIPMKEILAYVGSNQQWRLNINRTRPARGADPVIEYSWAVMRSSMYHSPEDFGRVLGVNVPRLEDGVMRAQETSSISFEAEKNVVVQVLPVEPSVKVEGLEVFHREGQTFITWQEDSTIIGERYFVFRSDKPITAETFSSADSVAILYEGSCRIREGIENLHFEKSPSILAFHNYILHDVDQGGKPLADGTGLLVWTVKEPGTRYYAVVAECDGRFTSVLATGKNSLAKPIDEHVEVPGSIKVLILPPAGAYYCHFMDYSLWNPRKTDDAPEGYGSFFHVCTPDPADNNFKKDTPVPVTVFLHGRGAVADRLAYNKDSAIVITPKCHMNNYYYGYADSLNWQGSDAFKWNRYPTSGTVRDYFWRSIEHALLWLKKKPKNFGPFLADMNRVYGTGFSMGATGCNLVFIRHGDYFAGVMADKGPSNILNTSNARYPIGWQVATWCFWGKPETHLKTAEGQDIYEYMSTPKWLLDHPEVETPYMEIIYGRCDSEIPFGGVVEYIDALERSRRPFSLAWSDAGHGPTGSACSKNRASNQPKNESLPAFAKASCNTPLETNPFSGPEFILIKGKCEVTDDRSIRTEEPLPEGDFRGKYITFNPYTYRAGGPFFRIASHEKNSITVAEGDLRKAFFFKGNKAPLDFFVTPGPLDGTINSKLEWSSSSHDFDNKNIQTDIVDEENHYGLSVRLSTYSDYPGMEYMPGNPDAICLVDITPRRLQKFKPGPKKKIKWSNIDFSDPETPVEIAHGVVESDESGLVTVPQFQVGKKGLGNRLDLKLF